MSIRHLAAGAVVVLLLTACASPDDQVGEPAEMTQTDTPEDEAEDSPEPPPGGATQEFQGVPDGVTPNVDAAAGAGWFSEPGSLYVIFNGSSSCPVVATGAVTIVDAVSDGAEAGLVIAVAEPPEDAICTMDFVPTTTVVPLPDGVSDGVAVDVWLGDHDPVLVPARGAEGEVGDPAWVQM